MQSGDQERTCHKKMEAPIFSFAIAHGILGESINSTGHQLKMRESL